MKNKVLSIFMLLFIFLLSLGAVFGENNDTIVSDCNDLNNQIALSEDICTDDFNELQVSNEDVNFAHDSDIISDSTDTIPPTITYVTPSTVFSDHISVEILCDDDSATIFYTLDGTNPLNSTSRFVYNNPFIINESTTVHFTAIDGAGNYGKSNYTWVGFFTMKNFFSYKTQYYDNVVTYLKESDLGENGAIWSGYQFNNGISNNFGPVTNITSWSNMNFVSSGSAVIDKNGHIYVTGEDGYLYCLNNQGLVIWRYGTTSKIICTPTIGFDGNIYFSNWMNSSLYCISPEGELIWKYELGNYNTGSSPVFGSDGTLYVVSSSNVSSCLFAFKNHELVWNCTLPVISGSTPTVASDGTLYLIGANHELIAVNWDGTLKFRFDLFRTDLGLVDSTYAVDDNLKETQVSVTIDDDTIYVINQPHYYTYYKTRYDVPMSWCFIRAYDSNGNLKWYNIQKKDDFGSFEPYYILYSAPTYYKGILYVSEKNNLMAFNATDGNILWKAFVNNASYSASSPLISGNEVIYFAHGNMVYAFDLNGEQFWNYTLTAKYGNPLCLSSPVLSGDGTLIVTTNMGIFAFNDMSADFTYEHVNNTERTIQFTDISTPGNNTYYWIFGDGSTSREQNPSHEYKQAGKYRVELIINHDGVNLARNTTIEVESWDVTPPSAVSIYINGKKSSGGVYDKTQTIDLVASDDSGVFTIYYTVDGSNPLNSETRRTYFEPIDIETYTVVKTVAIDGSNNTGKVSTFTFDITDSINVNNKINSTLIQEIQELLDNAEAGSKFVFDYDILYGANFTINKPLNIITNYNTVLVGDGINPVFKLGENATGSSINGFTIVNDGADGILIQDTSDVTVKESSISVNDAVGINIIDCSNVNVKDSSATGAIDGIIVNKSSNTSLNRVNVYDSYNNGVWIYESQGTILSNSLLENNGKDQYKSKANQVLIDGSNNTGLFNNTINYGYFGIHLYHNTNGVVMDNNLIYEGVGDAILLSNSYSNVNITHNHIDGCYNGIDFMGRSENVTIEHNLIENLHEHYGDLQSFMSGVLLYQLADYVYEYHFGPDEFFNHCYNGIQLSDAASNFHEGNTRIIDNVIIKVQHRAWESRKYNSTMYKLDISCAGYGYNLYDGSASYTGAGGATKYNPGKVDLVVDRIGDTTYRLRLINRLDGHYLSEIPEFDVNFIAGSYSQNVKFKGSEAVASFDVATTISSVTAKISTEVQKTVSFDIPITDGYSSSNRDKDPGYEAGEAINNPDPKVPSIDEYIKTHQSGNNGNGQGTGTGNGQGSGNGHGSSGHGGSNVNGREGELEGNSNNLVRTNGGTSPSVGVQAAAEGSSDSVEGGSESGETQDSAKAYEVTKEININNNNWQFVLAFILFDIIVILGYGYRRGKDDGDEM